MENKNPPNIQVILVTDDMNGMRLDKVLTEAMPELSRSRIQKLIEAGQITLQSNPVLRVSTKVESGQQYEVTVPPPEPSTVEPEAFELEILYQDPCMAVINKAPGVSVHPTEQNKRGTLVNALMHHLQDLSGIGGVLRPGIVHRLDRRTSGVILVAKTDEAHQALSSQFKQRTIKKIYWALVHGVPGSEEGEISQPIARHPSDRKRMTILADGRPATTRYKIKKKGLGGSWLEVYPFTGRTHQIRVHLKHIGCPIVRDTVYTTKNYQGKGQLERMLDDYEGIGLHARSITFQHPLTGDKMTFEAQVPNALAAVLDQLT